MELSTRYITEDDGRNATTASVSKNGSARADRPILCGGPPLDAQL